MTSVVEFAMFACLLICLLICLLALSIDIRELVYTARYCMTGAIAVLSKSFTATATAAPLTS